MPATSTIPPALKVMLKVFSTNLTKMSKHTRIPRARLIELFQTGVYNNGELYALQECLQKEFAAAFYRSSQRGNFNQAGTGHRQKMTIINNINHITNNNTVVIQGPPTAEEPEPTALVALPQRWEHRPVLPGGVVRQLGQPMQLGGVVRQIGASGAAQKLGRAA